MNLRWRWTLRLMGFALVVVVGAGLCLSLVQSASLEREYDGQVIPAAKAGVKAIDAKAFARLAKARETDDFDYRAIESTLKPLMSARHLIGLRVLARGPEDQVFLVFDLGKGANPDLIWKEPTGLLSNGLKSALWGLPATDPFGLDSDGHLAKSGYAPIKLNGETIGAVACCVDARSAQATMGVLRRFILGGSFFVLVLCFVAAFLLASWIADPLVTLAEQARRIQAGDLTKPLDEVKRKDETGLAAEVLEQTRKDLSQLAVRVNEIVAGVARQADAIRQFAESINQTGVTATSMIEGFGQEGRQSASVVTAGLTDLEAAGGTLGKLNQQIVGMSNAVLGVRGLALEGAKAIQQATEHVRTAGQSAGLVAEQVNLYAARTQKIDEMMGIIENV
ncbi:MAG: methyl-accepting chemotaxis protein, partial [Planctomycetaceae bacterium]